MLTAEVIFIPIGTQSTTLGRYMNMGVKRVVVSLKIDIRTDKDASLKKKIESIGFL